ncbi:MAG: acyl-[ACP]--phospholipid O-acyltransferase [Magnetococcales bacterium]|nr:acyl-[ACP]--phospholipid O-acyltransferase [Magnetococcales bacterium]
MLGQRRFLPLFVTQFLGAFNDNLFKNALVILITYKLTNAGNPQILVTMAAGLFILPFFLFSATAGQLADKLEKSQLIRWVKIWEIGVMLLAAAGFFWENAVFLLVVLFMLGMQATFFGPLKYGILPDHLEDEELIAGNGLIEAGTFLAILLGTIVGGVMILTESGSTNVALAGIVVAVAGWVASLSIPISKVADATIEVNKNFLAETWNMLVQAKQHRAIFLSTLGISWFWLVGATYLSQFPTFVKHTLGGTEEVVTLLLTLFSVGIGIGSLLCNKLLAGEINAKYVPLGALGITLFTVDLYFASRGIAPPVLLVNAKVFIKDPANWRVLFDLLMISISGGIYCVPLYAILQTSGGEAHRSRHIAANNIMNALFMTLAALLTMQMLAADITIPQVFLIMGVANLLVTIYIAGLLPDAVMQGVLFALFRTLYRVEVHGWENYHKVGDKAVMVANHLSFLDAALLATFLPDKPIFAINTHIAQQWWIKPFLQVVEAFPLDPTNPYAVRNLANSVKKGKRLLIFPEGRITVTGALMKIYEGPGVIADRADAPILPIRIEGAQYTPFSRLRGKIRLRWFPKITVTILPPRTITVPEEIKGRTRRQMVGLQLYDLMSSMLMESSPLDRTLFQSLVEARIIHGRKHVIMEDMARKPLDYCAFTTASLAFGRYLANLTSDREKVGVLLPTSMGGAITFFALQAYGRVPALLNFTAGLANLESACITAQLKIIITSKKFIETAKLQEVVESLSKRVKVYYLEEIKSSLTPMDKFKALIASRLLPWHRPDRHVKPEEGALILFTSGSEGTPKGVVLSHRNVLANCRQMAARMDFNPSDSVFNALPIFHSFGLTGGLLLPLLGGIKTFLYPSPLHYRIIPEMVYDTNSTILFGTDTFLSGYSRVAQPYDFYSLRYVFAGAEKLKDVTRRAWAEKFGLRIFEGYGSTETSPILSLNTPMHCRTGSVGRFLPGIHYRLEKIPNLEQGGRLIVSGPNIMLGYLRSDNPGVLQPPENGEYDTGDIVEISEMGYITIVGRAKRFAKIGGEMISLAAVEELAAGLWPGYNHGAVSFPDPRKGEQVILVSEHPEASRDALLEYARSRGVVELMVPRLVLQLAKLPLLGTGKMDYTTLKSWASENKGSPSLESA